MLFPGSDPSSDFRSDLSRRMLGQRTVMISSPVTASVAGDVTQQLTVLGAESDAPIRILMSHAPGGDTDAALSVYDVIRSLGVPVTTLASGRIQGAAVVVFCAPPRARRVALPNARFALAEPNEPPASGPPSAASVQARADAWADLKARVRSVLEDATGQAPDAIDRDVASQAAFGAQDAVEYGLADRVIASVREL